LDWERDRLGRSRRRLAGGNHFAAKFTPW